MEVTGPQASSLRSVQQLLWTTIAASLKPAEQDEVKRALGSSFIDENDALLKESSALADILGTVHKDSAVLLSRKQLCSNPERNMVESEILQALDKLRACASTVLFASSQPRDLEALIPTSDTQDKAVYDYVVATTTSTSGSAALQGVGPGRPLTPGVLRPSTASSRPLTASTLSSSCGLAPVVVTGGGSGPAGWCPRSRPSTASSTTSASTTTLSDPAQVVRCFQSKLNIFAIEEVKDALRSALKEERAALLDDIEYLTALLSDEADWQARAAAAPPSLHNLRHYSSKLKRLVAAEEARLQQEAVVSRMFDAAQADLNKAGKLRRMVSVSREPVPSPQLLVMPGAVGAHDSQGQPLLPPPLQRRPSSAASVRPPGSLAPQRSCGAAAAAAPAHPPDVLVVSHAAAGEHDSCRRPGRGVHSRPSSSECSRPPTATTTRPCQHAAAALGSTTSSSCAQGSGSTMWHAGSGVADSDTRCSHQPLVHRASGGKPHKRGPASNGMPVGTLDRPPPFVPGSSRPLSTDDEGGGCAAAGRQAVDSTARALAPSALCPGKLPSPACKPQVPGSLLDAQAVTLVGGVDAILAKHNYTPRGPHKQDTLG